MGVRVSPWALFKIFMNILKRNFILFVIFITGGAVLIIEVTAFRILAPYFGNTLYVTSSVIGVVLGALSLGYYIGGVASDKYPKYQVFFLLIIFAGASSLFIQCFSKTVLVVLGYMLDMRIGPPIASVTLFFAPSFILGMMSPFAIKLKSLTEKKKNIGKVSGSVFFWSTLGSIFGSFAAGFFLIPFFGIQSIIVSVGLVLLAIGIPGFIISQPKKSETTRNIFRRALPPLVFIVFSGFLSLFTPALFSPIGRTIYQKDGLYSQIILKETEIEGRTSRALQLDRAIHGRMFVDSGVPFGYIRYAALHEIFTPNIKSALMLGGGAYLFPKKLLSESNTLERVDVAEIEPELYALAKQYFGLKDDNRLASHITDGRRFLKKSERKYDLIFTDVFSSPHSIPFHFTTQEFFQLAKDKLSQNGFFIMNFTGMLGGEGNQMLLSEIKTLKSVFPATYVFAFDSPEKHESQNFIFISFKDDKRVIDFFDPRILEHEDEIIRNLPDKQLHIEDLDLESSYIFTDNFAPIEYLASKVIAHN